MQQQINHVKNTTNQLYIQVEKRSLHHTHHHGHCFQSSVNSDSQVRYSFVCGSENDFQQNKYAVHEKIKCVNINWLLV